VGYPSVTLPVDRWPELDRRLWQQANRANDPLEPGGRAAHWTENTRHQVAKDYGRFLFWLAATAGLEPQAAPGARLSRTRLGEYVSHLQATGMASTSLLSRLRGLCQAISVLDPAADLSLLARVCAQLKARAVPRRQKHLRLVDPAELVTTALAHYEVLINRPLIIRTCNHARDALMLAFLAHRPLRLANFAGLCLGENLIRTVAGGRLILKADRTKERRPYEADLPHDLLPALDHYLAEVRPRLLRGGTSDHLWVSMRGTPLSESAVYYQVTKITRRLLDRPLNPHLIRDCVLTALAIDAPDHVRAGARILGHSSLATGEAHYNHATAAAAQRRYFEVLAALRGKAMAEPDVRASPTSLPANRPSINAERE
jgi:integrase/recombinase XerD